MRVRGLRKSFGDREVLNDVDLEVRAGEFVALLGANGSGKSTLLRCVVGLETPDAGEIEIDGVAPRGAGGVAMVFQKIQLVGRRSALDNACSGALERLPLHRSLTPALFPRRTRVEAMECLDRVGLADLAARPAGRLSGGQQQRVAIARALCRRAKVLLADEPVSALDPTAAEQVIELLAELAQGGLAVAAVLHQPALALRHADRIVGLRDGRIIIDAGPKALTESDIGGLYGPERLVVTS